MGVACEVLEDLGRPPEGGLAVDDPVLAVGRIQEIVEALSIFQRGEASLEGQRALLKGLAGYKKTENDRRYRFLFMWFGGEEE